jgi:P27 family predicted phage terminase small subunit
MDKEIKLSNKAKKLLNEIIKEYGVEDKPALIILQTAFEAYDRLKQAQEVLQKEGLSFQNRLGNPIMHPLLKVEQSARSQMLQALKMLDFEFGSPDVIRRVGHPTRGKGKTF